MPSSLHRLQANSAVQEKLYLPKEYVSRCVCVVTNIFSAFTPFALQRHARELEDLVTWGKKAVEKMRIEEKDSVARGKELEEHERRRAELDE